MAKPTLEDLYDYDSVIVGERENEYAETIYLHDGEWYTEEELIDELLSEDKAQIASQTIGMTMKRRKRTKMKTIKGITKG